MIAPLDWGIGHATRCIPVVQAFLNGNAQVFIAAYGKGEKLLKENFPDLTFLPTQSYDVSYSAKGNMVKAMMRQVPKIVYRICQEHFWVKRIVKQYGIDIIVSDNRYGLFCAQARTIFLTHQLQIKAPFRWVEKILYEAVKCFVQKYDTCWVVDNEHPPYMGGILSHPKRKPPKNIFYIGILSRFHFRQQPPPPNKCKLLVLLSGPEPNRTLLEQKLVNMLGDMETNVVFVRGCIGNSEIPYEYPNIEFHNHLSSERLAEVIMASEHIICRSGYSTLMDLAALGSKASLLLIPTQGQTEQEYLAEYNAQQKTAYCFAEKEIDIMSFMQRENRHLKSMKTDEILKLRVQKAMQDTKT